MAVKMRLRREGKRKQPFYRVVVADARSPRDGRFIEDIGYYQPLREPSEINIRRDRALYWLGEGVQPSDAVRQLLRVTGIWEEFRPGDVGRQRPGAVAAAAAASAREASAAAGPKTEEPAVADGDGQEDDGAAQAPSEEATASDGGSDTGDRAAQVPPTQDPGVSDGGGDTGDRAAQVPPAPAADGTADEDGEAGSR